MLAEFLLTNQDACEPISPPKKDVDAIARAADMGDEPAMAEAAGQPEEAELAKTAGHHEELTPANVKETSYDGKANG